MANLSNINNKFIVESDGDVGIGVTTALDKLNVGDGNIRISQVGNVASQLILNTYQSALGNTTYKWFVGQTTSANSYSFQIGNGTTPYLHINSLLFGAAAGNVGIGTTGPGAKLVISGGGGAISDNGFQINSSYGHSGTGVLEINPSAASHIPLSILSKNGQTANLVNVTSFGGTAGNLFNVQSSGNVGIGTTSPGTLHGASYGTTRLQIDGGTDRGQMIIEGDSFAGIVLSDNGATANERVFATSVDEGKYSIKPINDNGTSTAGGVAVTVEHGGNVGIGTGSPDTRLTVEGTSGHISANIRCEDGYNASIGFSDASGNWYESYIRYHTDVNDMSFAVNSSERMRISSSGQVGFGTTNIFEYGNPSTLTNVQISNGNYSILTHQTTNSSASWGVWRNIVRYNGVYQIQAMNDAGTGEVTALEINRSGTSITNVLFPNGNVGIGTTSPNAKLHSRVGVSGASVWLPSNTPMVLESSGTNALNFLSPDSSEAYIMFSRPSNTTAGYMFYNHATDVFSFSRSLSLSNGITFNGLLQQNAQSVVLSNSAYANAAAVQAYATNTANVYPGYGFHKASTLGGFLYATSRTELRYRGDGGTDKVLLMADSDYEEGTFTVRLQGSGGQPTHSIQAGFYTKVGNVVTCVGTYTWNSSGSNANTTTKLEGFPFVNSSTTNARSVGSLGAVSGIALGYTLRLVIDPGHAGAYIIQQNSNNYTHNNTIAASGAIYGFELTYRTN